MVGQKPNMGRLLQPEAPTFSPPRQGPMLLAVLDVFAGASRRTQEPGFRIVYSVGRLSKNAKREKKNAGSLNDNRFYPASLLF